MRKCYWLVFFLAILSSCSEVSENRPKAKEIEVSWQNLESIGAIGCVYDLGDGWAMDRSGSIHSGIVRRS